MDEGISVLHHGLGWLSAMTARHDLSLRDGTSVCAVHASIDADDGPEITPDASDDELASLFGSAQYDVVLGVHTHVTTDQFLGELRLVNPASVSNSVGPEAGCHAPTTPTLCVPTKARSRRLS